MPLLLVKFVTAPAINDLYKARLQYLAPGIVALNVLPSFVIAVADTPDAEYLILNTVSGAEVAAGVGVGVGVGVAVGAGEGGTGVVAAPLVIVNIYISSPTVIVNTFSVLGSINENPVADVFVTPATPVIVINGLVFAETDTLMYFA